MRKFSRRRPTKERKRRGVSIKNKGFKRHTTRERVKAPSKSERAFAGVVGHKNQRCCWLRVRCAIESCGKRRAWLRGARLRKSRMRERRWTASSRYGGASHGGWKHTRTLPPPPPPPVGASTPLPRLRHRHRSHDSWVSTLTLHAPISLHSHVHEVARTGLAASSLSLSLSVSLSRFVRSYSCSIILCLALSPSLSFTVCLSVSLALSFTWLLTRAVRYTARGWYRSPVEVLVADTAAVVEVRSTDQSAVVAGRGAADLNFRTHRLPAPCLRGFAGCRRSIRARVAIGGSPGIVVAVVVFPAGRLQTGFVIIVIHDNRANRYARLQIRWGDVRPTSVLSKRTETLCEDDAPRVFNVITIAATAVVVVVVDIVIVAEVVAFASGGNAQRRRQAAGPVRFLWMFSDSRVPRLAAHQFLSAHEENVCVLVINMSILAPGSATRISLGSAYRVVSRRRWIHVASLGQWERRGLQNMLQAVAPKAERSRDYLESCTLSSYNYWNITAVANVDVTHILQ